MSPGVKGNGGGLSVGHLAGELRDVLSGGSTGYLFTGNGNFFGFAHDADGVF
jgi:hypothetical protein